MDPAVTSPPAETASERSVTRPWWRRAVWAGSGLLVVCGLLAGTLAWMLRPEALRQRVEAGLVQALGRPVLVRAADWEWLAASAGSEAPAQIVLRLHGLEMPASAAGSGAGAVPLRGLRVGKIAVFLGAAPGGWWRAWRAATPWPVLALRAEDVLSVTAGAPGDGLGSWHLTQLDLVGIVAAVTAPRVLRVQARGRWQGAPERSWIPLSAALRDVAVTPGFAGGFSLDQAVLQFGALRARLADVSVGQDSATFAVEMAPVNLRDALPPLGVPMPATEDAEAFTRVAAQAECHADFDTANYGAGCDSVVLKVDDTTFTGQIWRALRVQGGADTLWQLRLAADRLNLDRYLPPENLQEPPTAVPWNLADAWPLRADLTVRDLRVAGLRFRNAKLVLQAGEQGLVRE